MQHCLAYKYTNVLNIFLRSQNKFNNTCQRFLFLPRISMFQGRDLYFRKSTEMMMIVHFPVVKCVQMKGPSTKVLKY